METLTQMKCTACRGGDPLLQDKEIAVFQSQVSDWQVLKRGGIQRLERAFKFSNFIEAVQFTDQVAALAENEGHHPAILTEWGRVTVRWWTHKIKGLHRNDFIMAAKTTELYRP